MDFKTKSLVAIFFTLVVVAVVWKYDVFFINRDFIIHDYIDCDPSIDSCFVAICDPLDTSCDETPYKKITKNAKYISLCENYKDDADCPPLTCANDEAGCVITLCSEDTLDDGEKCIFSPEQTTDIEASTTPEQDASTTESILIPN